MHRLVLPLPRAFASDCCVGGNGEYSVFERAAGDELSPIVQSYLKDLVAFLSHHRVVQYHPENYFSFKVAAERDADDPIPRHFNGEPITDEEIKRWHELLGAFSSFLPTDAGECMKALASIIRDGPMELTKDVQSADAALLRNYFATTQRLMMHRRRREENDYPSLTFQPTIDRVSSCEPSTRGEGIDGNDQFDKQCIAEDTDFIVSKIVDHNMCAKKQHEVSVMRDTIRDLIRCSSMKRGGNDGSSPARSSRSSVAGTTVINIGEGKGYCSRVLALSDGIQVIGLDCNPDHKEGSSGRVERIVEGHVGTSGVNLCYRHRGHTASITCRVGLSMNWTELLRGHVATRLADGTVVPMHASLTAEDAGAACDNNAPTRQQAVQGHLGNEVLLPAPLDKIQCLICGHIMRKHFSSMVLRHTRDHVRSAEAHHRPLVNRFDTSLLPMQPTDYKTIVEALPQTALVAKLIETCFSETIVLCAEPKDAGAVTDGPREALCMHPAHVVEPTVARSVVLPRATRVNVWVMVQLHEHTRVAEEKPTSTLRKVVIPATATILGYDEGTGRHKMVIDEADVAVFQKKRPRDAAVGEATSPSVVVVNPRNLTCHFMCSVIAYPWEPSEDTLLRASQFMASDPNWSSFALPCKNASKHPLSLPTSTGPMPFVVLRNVVPMLPPLSPAVSVPALSNAVLMGLHTCGDLGSNICRLYAASSSPGLLLVSCCWHALTNDGFPLSAPLRAAGYRAESISLMLATQPLDMWGAESSEGHRGSARLLFFRGMLAPLWKRLVVFHGALPTSSCGCTFPPIPHLEPGFLRRIAKVKNTISFGTFAAEVIQHYLVRPTGWALRQQEGQPDRTLCAACREWITSISMLPSDGSTVASTFQSVADELEAHYMRSDFGKFVGLTVLRMWMSHLIESLLLLDRALYLHDALLTTWPRGSDVTLAPLFDGTLSPRMYGILARRL